MCTVLGMLGSILVVVALLVSLLSTVFGVWFWRLYTIHGESWIYRRITWSRATALVPSGVLVLFCIWLTGVLGWRDTQYAFSVLVCLVTVFLVFVGWDGIDKYLGEGAQVLITYALIAGLVFLELAFVYTLFV